MTKDKKELSKLSVFELRSAIMRENEWQGDEVINPQGKKAELIERIIAYGLNVGSDDQAKIAETKETNPYLTKSRLDDLAIKIKEKLAGKGEFRYLLDAHDGSSTVEFSGGDRGKWSQTLLVSDNDILKVANAYIQRVAIGKDGGISR